MESAKGPLPAAGHDAGLQREQVVHAIDRQALEKITLDPLLRRHLVAGHQRVVGDDDLGLWSFTGCFQGDIRVTVWPASTRRSRTSTGR